MNISRLSLVFALFCVCNGFAQTVDSTLYNTAYTYFTKILKGNTPVVPLSNKYGETDSVSIWRAWQKAVTEEPGGTLARPDNFAASSSWTLPSSLEPNAVLNYYYGRKGSAGNGKSPLFVYLHGSGTPATEWSTGLSICKGFNDSPSTYFIPKIPQTGSWYRWYHQSKQWFIEKLFRQSMARGDIDPSRIYIFGISEGGYGSQRLASFYGDYLAGAGPMASGEPLKNAPVENVSNIAFSLYTGALDADYNRNVLTEYAGLMLDSVQEIYPGEYKHNVKTIAGMGHGINYSIDTPWLKQFSRNPYPKHFVWEDFEMHDRHRSGFYNIIVTQRPTTDLNKRTRYEMVINGNTINILVQNVSYACIQRDSKYNMELKYKRTYTTALSGSITLLLNNQLVDLSQPVVVYINNKKMYEGIAKTSNAAMMKSLATFGDPLRMFPASINLMIPSSGNINIPDSQNTGKHQFAYLPKAY